MLSFFANNRLNAFNTKFLVMNAIFIIWPTVALAETGPIYNTGKKNPATIDCSTDLSKAVDYNKYALSCAALCTSISYDFCQTEVNTCNVPASDNVHNPTSDNSDVCKTLCDIPAIAKDESVKFCTSLPSGGGGGDNVSEAQLPLFLVNYADPNVMFLIDDSSSMMEELMPDDQANYVYSEAGDVYNVTALTDTVPEFADRIYGVQSRSAGFNTLYYNPSKTYRPWVGWDGDSYKGATDICTDGSTDFKCFDASGNVVAVDADGDSNVDDYCAPHNPADLSEGCRLLSESVTENRNWMTGDIVGQDGDGYLTSVTSVIANLTYYPATYYVFDETNSYEYPIDVTGSCDPAQNPYAEDRVACFDKVEIQSTNAPFAYYDSRYDCVAVADECSYAEEMTNFANWYTYYRSKALAAKAAVGFAFEDIGADFRVGLSMINSSGSADIDSDRTFGVLESGVDAFESTHKQNFYTDLYSNFYGGNTAIYNAWEKIGSYFEEGSSYVNYGPWSDDPGNKTDTTALADAAYCRRTFNISMLNDEPSDTSSKKLHDLAWYYFDIGRDHDNNEGLVDGLGDGGEMGPIDIDSDSLFSSYGDNDAVFSHLTQLTIAFDKLGSVAKTLTEGADISALIDLDSNPERTTADFDLTNLIDDLYYAAISSGGRYYEASSPDNLRATIQAALRVVEETTSGYLNSNLSGAAVALNSGSLFDGSILYQALFNAAEWTGNVIAYSIDSEDGTKLTKVAEVDIPTYLNRHIATYGCSNVSETCDGVDFDADSLKANYLTTSGATTLADAITTYNFDAELAWLRGDTTYDNNDSYPEYRDRQDNLMGDVIHSAPVYIGTPGSPFANFGAYTAEGNSSPSYSEFRLSQHITICNDDNDVTYDDCPVRDEMVYVGANDGMLHMFKVNIVDSDDDGVPDSGALDEKGAFIPKAVLEEGKLPELYQAGYTHKYYVDGTVTVGDAYFEPTPSGMTVVSPDGDADGKVWQTVVVGGLRGGGKGVYAINATEPSYIYANAGDVTLPDLVMWEYTAKSPIGANAAVSSTPDDDLGYTHSRPNIARLPTGDWAVIFGNGYDSVSGDACLYILKLSDGSPAFANNKVCTGYGVVSGAGRVGDPTGNNLKNGLSTVIPIDINRDYIIDYIYGGDLYGNLWRFDMQDANGKTDFDINIKVSGKYAPLFDASDFSGEWQPITTRPQVGRHPAKAGGVLVYFGTGKYLDEDDKAFSADTTETETFYAIWDTFEGESIDSSYTLFEQKILAEITQAFEDDPDTSFSYRITTDFNLTESQWVKESGSDYVPAYWGWYMDLVNLDIPNSPDVLSADLTSLSSINGMSGLSDKTYGERQITDPILINGKVVFTTLIPDTNVCASNDSGWLMELDAKDGSRLTDSPFDVNGKDGFKGDLVSYDDAYEQPIEESITVSGRKSTVGLLPTPGILSDYSEPDKGREYKYMSGSTGAIEAVEENAKAEATGFAAGRQSWRQLFR